MHPQRDWLQPSAFEASFWTLSSSLALQRCYGQKLALFQRDRSRCGMGCSVRINPTMGPVSPTSHFWSSIHLNMFNDEVVSIKALVFGIALGIFHQVQQELSRLQRPSTLGSTVNISLSMTSNSTHKPPERNDLLMSDNILQIFGGTVQRHGLDSLSCLSSILEVNPQV